MTKLFFIRFALIFSTLFACSKREHKQIPPEFQRFEEMLRSYGELRIDSIDYIYWNNISCSGCRVFTVNLLLQDSTLSHIKIITPLVNSAITKYLNKKQVILDTNGIFTKKYIGMENIGIIKTYNNSVFSIKNYNADEMEQLKTDLTKK